jgi:hypothetical protein
VAATGDGDMTPTPESSMSYHASRPFFLLLFVALTMSACKDKKKTIPKTAEARVEQMVSKLPQKTETAVVVGDLDEMRSSINLLQERLPNTGVVDSVQKQIHQQFGIDLLDAESWKRAGVAPNAGATVAIYRSRVVFLTYVENRQAFEKLLTEKTKKAFGIEAPTKTDKVGKHKIKVLSEDPARQIAWLYQGKLALVTLPATSAQGAVDDGSAKIVLGDVADQEQKTSLFADEGFKQFNEALVKEHPIALYMNPRAGLESEAVKAELGTGEEAKAVSEWVKKNVTFVGAGLNAKGDQARLKTYVGMKPDILKRLEQAQKLEGEVDWGHYATENLMLGVRLTMNVQQAYDLLLEALPDDRRRAFRRDLKRAGERFSLDLEKELFDKLAGHVGLFFYGIAGNPMQMMGARNPAQIASSVGLMLVIKFKSAEALDSLVSKIVANAGGAVSMRPFTNLPENENYKVLSLSDPTSMGNFFIHGDTVLYATRAFGDEAIYKYLQGERDEESLAEIEGLDLGKQFTVGKKFSGAYFNSKRAQDNLGNALAMGGVGEILGTLQEAQLSLDTDKAGAFGLLTIDMVPAPKKDGGDSKGSKDSK